MVMTPTTPQGPLLLVPTTQPAFRLWRMGMDPPPCTAAAHTLSDACGRAARPSNATRRFQLDVRHHPADVGTLRQGHLHSSTPGGGSNHAVVM